MAIDYAAIYDERTWQPITDFAYEPSDLPVGSPMWWAETLHNRLAERLALVALFEDYYEGRHKLGLSTAEYRRVFGKALAPVSDPWMSLVVRASVERLQVQGFRVGEGEALEGDKDAWNIWQVNDLDEDSPLLFTEAVKIGESYLLVWRDKGDDIPRITVEHPAQMIVARDPGDRRKVTAALKEWTDLDGAAMGTLYLPDRIVRMRRERDRQRWSARDVNGISAEARNPLGRVPVVPVVNDPHMLPCYPPTSMLEPPHLVPPGAHVGLGRSDLADVISAQDQINKLLCDLLVASEFGAHRQRWMTGVETSYDADGNPVPIVMGASRMVAVEDPGARIGDLGATDLTNYVRPLEQRIQSLASRTRVPVHYLLGGQGSFPSGESLRAAETGLVAKVRDKQRSFGGAFERAIRLAFAWLGDPRQNAQRAEIDWHDPETRTESEFVDALTKKLAIGVPMQQLWEDYGYSPQEIDRMKAMIRQAAIEGMLLPPPTPAQNGAVNEPPPQEPPPQEPPPEG